MKRITITIPIAVLSIPFLAACNGGSSHGRGAITPQNSNEVGSALSAMITGGASSAASGGSSSQTAQLRRSNVRAFDGSGDTCYTVSGDPSDADNDGIPADATYTLTNCAWSQDGWSETYSGTENVTDTTPDAAGYDYTDGYDLAVNATDGTDTEADHVVGADVSSMADGHFLYSEQYGDDYSGSYQGQSFAGSFAENLDWDFAPDCSGGGQETVSGTWTDTFDGQVVDSTIATTVPLTIDPACDSGVVAGTIVATSGDSSETVTWTGCNQYTDTYSGPQS